MLPDDRFAQAESLTVGVISDTHGQLHPSVPGLFRRCDVIIHAGDICGHGVLEGLRAIAPLCAVAGNCDSPFVNPGLEKFELVTLARRRVAVIHDLFALDVDPVAMGVTVVVHGHSHQSEIAKRAGVLYLNPGSAGPRRFSFRRSVAILKISPSELSAELLEFDE